MFVQIKAKEYQLYLFDMDGLLIDTENLHFEAYREFLSRRGYTLPWTFNQYLQIAHSGSSALKEAIYRLFPDLFEKEPKWNVLYEEKKATYMDVLLRSEVRFMPGAEKILTHLIEAQRTLCVVTNSTADQVDIIVKRLPLLQSIEGWIVRENYEKSKPDPQCYKLAIDRWAYPGFRIIGFEDSARGLTALVATSATSILVSPYQYLQLEAYEGRFTQVPSFELIELV